MIGTELLKGQGLGNQLFCYVTTRCIAMKQGRDFSILGSDTLANNIHSSCGLYFMDLDFGVKAGKEDFTGVYSERDDRIFTGSSRHDMTHGCYVTAADEEMLHVKAVSYTHLGALWGEGSHFHVQGDVCHRFV